MTTATMSERTSSAADEARAVQDRLIEAFNARRYDDYLDTFTEDLESFTGIATPLRWQGLSSWKELIGGLGELASVTYEQRDATYRAYNDDTVLVNAYFVFTTVSQGGAMERQTGRASHTLVRIDGEWRVANQHYSPMF